MLTLTEEQLAAIQSRIATSARRVSLLTDRDTKLAEVQIPAFVPESVSKRSGRAQRTPRAGKGAIRATGKIRLRESDVLRACLELLEAHPKVALAWRANVGAVKAGDRYVRFGFRGCSDILGIMAGNGKLLCVECKATGKRASEDQAAFLRNVSLAGGYSMCVDNPGYLANWLTHI